MPFHPTFEPLPAILQAVFDTLPFGLGIADARGNLLAFNRAILEPGGYTEADIQALGNVGFLYHDPLERARVLEAFERDGRVERTRVQFRHKDGRPYPTMLSLRPLGVAGARLVLAVVEPAPETTPAASLSGTSVDSAALQSRLTTLGQLSAGVAHDFNNVLAVVMGYAELLIDLPGVPPQGREMGETIIRQAQQAGELVGQILNFVRRAPSDATAIDMGRFLRESEVLLSRALPETIAIRLNLCPDRLTVRGSRAELQQVIANLAVNARDAMRAGGELTLAIDSVDVRGSGLPLPGRASPAALDPGRWARVTLADTGEGIPAEALSRVFEPFFTTKGPSQGTGLGLFQAQSIVRRHGGHITIESRVGRGTEVSVYLRTVSEPEPSEEGDLSLPATGNGRTILIVEDDEDVRNVILGLLERMGFRTLSATDGRAALDLLAVRTSEVALILSDVVMPGMGGLALAGVLRDRHPEVPLILMTGHGPATERLDGLPLLTKPIRARALSRAIADRIG